MTQNKIVQSKEVEVPNLDGSPKPKVDSTDPSVMKKSFSDEAPDKPEFKRPIACEIFYSVFPTNPEANFAIDNANLEYRTHETLDDAPYQWDAYSWNLDDTHAHACTILVGLLPKNVITPWLLTWQERTAASGQ